MCWKGCTLVVLSRDYLHYNIGYTVESIALDQNTFKGTLTMLITTALFVLLLKCMNLKHDETGLSTSSESTDINIQPDTIITSPNSTSNINTDIIPRRHWKEAILVENGTCAQEVGTRIHVGRRSESADFIPLYETCHDKANAANLFTVHHVSGHTILAHDKSHKRPQTFSQGNYFPGLDVHNLYSIAKQTETIAGILGSSPLATEYINGKRQLFFSRGHMAPDADFIEADSQDATYYFLNTAPQWQTFNGGNWNALETAIRRLAVDRKSNLTIYTGTFGITTLADIHGVHQPIYLAYDENKNGLIPAPKYYWKVVHDTVSNTATAVIGINNPYGNVKPEEIICTDVCAQITWVKTLKLTDIRKGYTFCCAVSDLGKAIPYAPDLDLPLLA